jgi:hypothetical protein
MKGVWGSDAALAASSPTPPMAANYIELYNLPNHIQLSFVEGLSAGSDVSFPKASVQFSYELPDKLIISNSINVFNLVYADISTLQPSGHTSLIELISVLTSWVSEYNGVNIHANSLTVLMNTNIDSSLSILSTYHTKVTGSGALVEYDTENRCAKITSGASDSGRAALQTKQYFEHVGGECYAIFTCVLRTDFMLIGNECRVGVYDDINDKDGGADATGCGIFLSLSEFGDISLTWRDTVDGVQIDTVYLQSEWNLDVMNGCTGSGINLDPSVMNTYVLKCSDAFMKFGIMYNQLFYPAHIFNNQNTSSTLSVQKIHAPFRMESINSAADVAAITRLYSLSVLTDSCSIMSNSINISVDSGMIATSVAAASSVPLLSVANRGGTLCRINKKVEEFNLYCSALARYSIIYNATITGGTWLDTEFDAIKYNISASGAASGTVIKSGYLNNECRVISAPCPLYASIDGASGDSLTLVVHNMSGGSCEVAGGVSVE